MLVKRLATEWEEVPAMVKLNATSEDPEVKGNIRNWLHTYNMYTPTEKDLSGAIASFIRLQVSVQQLTGKPNP